MSTKKNNPLRTTRHEALQEALASLRMEGRVPNAANMRLLQEWASHRISADAIVAVAAGFSDDNSDPIGR